MRKYAISAIVALSTLICATPSQAKTAFLSGTVLNIFISGAGSSTERITFTMSFAAQPTTGCKSLDPNHQIFVLDPASIGDAQNRKDLLTLIFASRTSGIPMTVDWDTVNIHCDALTNQPIPTVLGLGN